MKNNLRNRSNARHSTSRTKVKTNEGTGIHYTPEMGQAHGRLTNAIRTSASGVNKLFHLRGPQPIRTSAVNKLFQLRGPQPRNVCRTTRDALCIYIGPRGEFLTLIPGAPSALPSPPLDGDTCVDLPPDPDPYHDRRHHHHRLLR
jgi:hypothetical protein